MAAANGRSVRMPSFEHIMFSIFLLYWLNETRASQPAAIRRSDKWSSRAKVENRYFEHTRPEARRYSFQLLKVSKRREKSISRTHISLNRMSCYDVISQRWSMQTESAGALFALFYTTSAAEAVAVFA